MGSPFEQYYQEPVYDNSDTFGAFDPEGNEAHDGVPDNPGRGELLQPIRTGQKDNFSINGGITWQLSHPVGSWHQMHLPCSGRKTSCALRAKIADKRLVYEIKGIKNCADLLKDGIVVRGVYGRSAQTYH